MNLTVTSEDWENDYAFMRLRYFYCPCSYASKVSNTSNASDTSDTCSAPSVHPAGKSCTELPQTSLFLYIASGRQ
jgi:hypothetical protein